GVPSSRVGRPPPRPPPEAGAGKLSGLERRCLCPDYVGTGLRAPAKPLVNLPEGFNDFPAPLFPRTVADLDHDLTRQHAGEPIGERIIVTGRVLDTDGRPLRKTIVEVWHAHAAGRDLHEEDRHRGRLDATPS